MKDWMSDYIESTPEIMGGMPVIKGTRLTVAAVMARLEGGETLAELAGDYPCVNPVALAAAAAYGWRDWANMLRAAIGPRVNDTFEV